MRSLEFKINSVEQVLKTCKSGWALSYWNNVLRQLHARRDMSYTQRQYEYQDMDKRPIIIE